jgi:hypothetical protein
MVSASPHAMAVYGVGREEAVVMSSNTPRNLHWVRVVAISFSPCSCGRTSRHARSRHQKRPGEKTGRSAHTCSTLWFGVPRLCLLALAPRRPPPSELHTHSSPRFLRAVQAAHFYFLLQKLFPSYPKQRSTSRRCFSHLRGVGSCPSSLRLNIRGLPDAPTGANMALPSRPDPGSGAPPSV